MPDTIAWNYTRHLSNLKEVDLRPVHTFDLEESSEQQKIGNKIIRRFYPKGMTRRVSQMLMDAVSKHKPDVLLVIKGMHIDPDLLMQIKGEGVYLVNYNPDHPIHFETKASGNQNILKGLRYYHLVCTYSPVIEQQLMSLHQGFKTCIIPFGYSPSRYNDNALEHVVLKKRVCFAGTADPYRAEQVKKLIQAGIEVDVYGAGYERWIKKTKGLTIFPGVFSDAYNELLQLYAVSLNLYRRQNQGSHNMRSFEIPAVGGIQVVERSSQMAGFFKDGSEVFMYDSDGEWFEIIRDLLARSDNILLHMKDQIRSKTLQSGYSYADRAKELLKAIQSNI